MHDLHTNKKNRNVKIDHIFCSGARLLRLLRPHPLVRNITEHIIMFLSELSALR